MRPPKPELIACLPSILQGAVETLYESQLSKIPVTPLRQALDLSLHDFLEVFSCFYSFFFAFLPTNDPARKYFCRMVAHLKT